VSSNVAADAVEAVPGAGIDFTPALQVAIARVREEVAALHAELMHHGLVAWTDGDVSARVPGADLFVIRASDVDYGDLGPEHTVLRDFDGAVIPDTPGADHAPSRDAAAHGEVYRRLSGVGGIAHTLSPYAAAWAAVGLPIPCLLRSTEEQFGGDIPVGERAGDRPGSLGADLVEFLHDEKAGAVLMRGVGPFTVGADPRAAVTAAVLLEEAARTAYLARQLGGSA